jgi:phosphate/sulfate permease
MDFLFSGTGILLIVCILLVCTFEFINGFHDTANAVAPVIYTNSLEAKKAVILAAICNFLWVLLGGTGVAMGIIHLLPLDVIADQSVTFGICVVVSLLFSAIIWNLWTWYFGIPASSSHTLIGAILWVSLVMYTLYDSVTLPIAKTREVFESLLVSPIVGFMLAFWAMHILHLYIKNKMFFSHPGMLWNRFPETWIKTSLIGTSAFVSFAHGSNDGQKWVWLAMLILIALMPAHFAINPAIDMRTLRENIVPIEQHFSQIDTSTIHPEDAKMITDTREKLKTLNTIIQTETLENTEKIHVRQLVLEIQKNYQNIIEKKSILIPNVHAGNPETNELLGKNIALLSDLTNYVPLWVIVMISISLGCGTMIWWKRIVITIWEKIGKEKLSYAQWTVGALMTAITISTASHLHLPLSTTHILSSGIAGTMAHEYGKHGLQWETIKSILLTWILTLPIATLLAGGIFWVLISLFVK